MKIKNSVRTRFKKKEFVRCGYFHNLPVKKSGEYVIFQD